MGDIKVQRGVTDVGNTGATDSTFTTVSALTAAYEYNNNNRFAHGGRADLNAANVEVDDAGGEIELTATGTLTFRRTSGSLATDMRFAWELIEYTGAASGANEFIVRSRNTVSLTGASNTATLDTTPTNTDKCVPFITGVTNTDTSNDADEICVIAYINDSGDLAVERAGTTATTQVQVVTVEFTGSNWEVYHGTSTSSADTGTITLNTDSDGAGGSTGDVNDWADTFIHGSLTSTDNGLDSINANYEPGSGTTTVDWTLNSGNNTSHKHFVHAVYHPDMVVTRFNNTSSTAGATNVDITSAGLTDIAEAAVIGTSITSGGGTAYQRGWRNFRLTSTTNVEHWCHRSGNTMAHRIQVIDFSGVETSGGATYDADVVATTGESTADGDAKAVRISDTAATTGSTTASAGLTSWSPVVKDEVTQFSPGIIRQRYGNFAKSVGVTLTADVDATVGAATADADARFLHQPSVDATTGATTATADAKAVRVATTDANTGSVTADLDSVLKPQAAVDANIGATTALATAQRVAQASVDAGTGPATALSVAKAVRQSLGDLTAPAASGQASATAIRIATISAETGSITGLASGISLRTASVDANIPSVTSQATLGGIRKVTVDADTAATTAQADGITGRIATTDATTDASTADATVSVAGINIASVDATAGSITATGQAIAPTVAVTEKTPAGGLTGAERYDYRRSLKVKEVETAAKAEVSAVTAEAYARVKRKRVRIEPKIQPIPEKVTQIIRCQTDIRVPVASIVVNGKYEEALIYDEEVAYLTAIGFL